MFKCWDKFKDKQALNFIPSISVCQMKTALLHLSVHLDPGFKPITLRAG